MDMYEELEADLLDRFGEYPDEVAHLLTTGRIKMDGDRALLESIRKRDQKVKFVLSKIGTKTYSVEQLFEALSATSLKADLAVEKEQMTISLKLPKDCKEAVWIQEIAALQPHCDKKNTNIRKERIPFKRRPRRWHKRNATNDARCRCVNHCFLHCKSVECVLSRSFSELCRG